MTDTLPHEWVKIHAGANPNAPAVVFADGSISYAELDRRVNAYAHSLLDEGIGVGDLVPLEATLDLETIVALVAIPRLGAVPGPYGPHRIEADDAPGESSYAVVPTSGSSGRPRGVVLTPGNVTAALEASRRRLRNDRGDRWLLTLPLFHVGGLSIVWRSFAAGGSVELHEGFDAVEVAETLRGGSVSLASLVPTMLHRILEVDPGPYEGIKGVLLGGAPASRDLVERGLAARLPVLQTYGMTETCSQVATVEPGKTQESLGTAGRPLDGFSVTIDRGEIVVDGPAVSPGYFGEAPRIGPFRTGDLGRLDEWGRLVVTGRTADVIITGGENVPASRVEAAIVAVPEVVHAAVVGVDDEEWGQVVVAVVEAEDGVIPHIEATVAGRLAHHELPRHWIRVDHLPLLATGKPDRRAAQAMAARMVK